MAEIKFERLLAALESTRGTAIAAPTHLLNLAGVVKPNINLYKPKERRGTLIRNYRHKKTHVGSEWSLSGDLDLNEIIYLLQMAITSVTSPATPGGATNTRRWTFVRDSTSDAIKASSFWWGDPNIQVFRSAFCMATELVIKTDTEDGVASVELKGIGNLPGKVSAPTVPASIAGEISAGFTMQLWIDTSSAIGTTEITNRLLSAEITIPTGVVPKRRAAGATATGDFNAVGRNDFAATLKLVFEVPDTTQYDNWAAADTLKVRLRLHGPLIETTFYNYLTLEIYGSFADLDWGEYADGANRTIQLTIESEYDAGAGHDFQIVVQNQRTGI